MITALFLALSLSGGMPGPLPPSPLIAFKTHTYEARIRFKGRVSTTQVKASDAGQAKKLVQMQFGPSVTVLSVRKVD